MRIANSVLLVVCVMCTMAGGTAAKTSESADARITSLLKAISSAANAGKDVDSADSKLLAYMNKACLDRSLLTDPLKSAQDAGLSCALSKDKKLRVFTWDTMAGGTMHYYEGLIEYLAGDTVKCQPLNPPKKNSEDGPDPGCYCTEVETYQTKDNKTVYLLLTASVFSGQDHARAVRAVTIKDGKLTAFPFFDTKKKVLDSIDYAVQCVEYNPDGEIQFSDAGNTMGIPLVNNDGKISGKFLNYRFDGNRFVFTAQASRPQKKKKP